MIDDRTNNVCICLEVKNIYPYVQTFFAVIGLILLILDIIKLIKIATNAYYKKFDQDIIKSKISEEIIYNDFIKNSSYDSDKKIYVGNIFVFTNMYGHTPRAILNTNIEDFTYKKTYQKPINKKFFFLNLISAFFGKVFVIPVSDIENKGAYVDQTVTKIKLKVKDEKKPIKLKIVCNWLFIDVIHEKTKK